MIPFRVRPLLTATVLLGAAPFALAQQALELREERTFVDGFPVETKTIAAETIDLALSPRGGGLVRLDGQTVAFRHDLLGDVDVRLQIHEPPELLDGPQLSANALQRRLAAASAAWTRGREDRRMLQPEVLLDTLGLAGEARALWLKRSSTLRYVLAEEQPAPRRRAVTEWYVEVRGAIVVVRIECEADRRDAVCTAIFQSIAQGALVPSPDLLVAGPDGPTPAQLEHTRQLEAGKAADL